MHNNLSDFDEMKNVRLPMWARWGRQDSGRPDPEAGCGSIYQLGRADRDGDGETAPEEPSPKIDNLKCEELDRLILRLPLHHRHVICGYYYKRKEQFRHKVPEAVRALLDAEEAAQGRRP